MRATALATYYDLKILVIRLFSVEARCVRSCYRVV